MGTLAGAAALALAACGDDGTGPTPTLEPVPPVTELTVTPADLAFSFLGDAAPLAARLVNARGATVEAPRIHWYSLDTAVARVDTAGRVTSVGVGATGIVAQFLQLADTARIAVARVPVSMQLSLDTILFTEVGRTARVSSIVRDGSGSVIPAPGVQWATSNPAAVAVDGNGTIRAVADGRAVVTATADTVVRTVSVRVATRPASMTVSPARIDLDGVSDTSRVVTSIRNAAGVSMYPLVPTYVSSDTSVVSVDFIGFVIARGAGTATITVTADTLSAVVPVTVTRTVGSVQIVPDTATVVLGATRVYAAVVRDRFGIEIRGAPVVWTSSDVAVATVDQNGVVSSIATGTATLTATSGSRSDTALIRIVAPPTPTPGPGG